MALTGGYDNRINIWDLRRGRRHKHFRIVPLWAFVASPPTGRAHAIWTMPPDGGRLVALVATSDGTVRALEPRRFPWGVRRMGVMTADAVAAVVLSNGRAIVATAGEDGIVRIWKPEVFTDGSDDNWLLCEMIIEVPVRDISFADHDTLVITTPNGLTAIKLDAALLEKEASLATNPVGIRYGADHIRR
jgi:WD40 repeat protein